MKKLIFLLGGLFLFACSSDNPISANAETINGKITFEFEAPPPYNISYPDETLSTNIFERIGQDPNMPTGQVQKTIRTFDYQFPPFAQFNINMELRQFSGHMIIRVLVKTDSTHFVFTSKDFTSERIGLGDTIELPF